MLTSVMKSPEVQVIAFFVVTAVIVGYRIGEQHKHVVYDIPDGYVRTDYVNAEIFSLRKKIANYESQNQ